MSHLSPEVLGELALDLLEGDERASAENHVGACAVCARELAASVEALGALALSVGTVSPPASLRKHVLGQAAGDPFFSGILARFSRLFDVTEARAREILATVSDPASWEPYIPGVLLLHFDPGPSVAEADAGIVRFAAGIPYPEHEHLGDEHMLILSGGLRDDVTGKLLRAGDIAFMAPGTRHSFTISSDEDCLAAVLLYGGLPVFTQHERGSPS
jgi:putative transcriptional regulator